VAGDDDVEDQRQEHREREDDEALRGRPPAPGGSHEPEDADHGEQEAEQTQLGGDAAMGGEPRLS
jgi:hypothetical protein